MPFRLNTTLYSNSFWLILNSFLGSFLGFIFWIILTRYYTPDVIGTTTAIIASMGLIANISNLGLSFSLIRFLPEANDNKTSHAMLNSSFTLVVLASLIIVLIFVFGLNIWSPALMIIRRELLFGASFVFFTIIFTLFELISQAFNAKRSSKFMFFHNLIANVIKFPASIIFAQYIGSLGIFISIGFGILMATIISLFFLIPKIQKGYHPCPVINFRLVKILAKYSIINHVANQLWILPGMILPLIVINALGSDTNAYFYIAWSIASVVFSIPVSIATILLSEGSYNVARLSVITKKAILFCIVILIPLYLIITFLGEKILLIFGLDYSKNATDVLNLLVISSFPMTINNIYLSVKRIRKEVNNLIIYSLLLNIFTLVPCYLFLNIMGVLGVGLGVIIGQTTIALITSYNLLFRNRITLHLRK